MHSIFDQPPDRQDSDCIKWRLYQDDVLPMWVADMDFRSPESVIQALKARVEHGFFGYPRENPALREVICARLADRYHWQVYPDDILLLPGVVTAFNQACHAWDPPGSVLVQPPIYPPMLDAPGHAGLDRVEAPLIQDANGHYGIDFAAFEAALRPDTKLFLFCNPHNPTGRVFTGGELSSMAEICLKHGMTIISDEIHCDLVYRGQHHQPIATLAPEVAQNTITLIAPSKTYNIAGLQCSFAVIQNPALRQQFRHGHKGLVEWVNLMGQEAALAAYQGGDEWLRDLLAYLEANRDFLLDFVERELPGIHVTKPEATYLAWLDCRELGLEEDPADFFVERARVGLNRGKTFGTGGEGFARLNFGCPRDLLEEGLERIKHALA